MLFHSTHNHVAFKQSPEWERRLLWFADSTGVEGEAEGVEVPAEIEAPLPTPASKVEEMVKALGTRILEKAPEVSLEKVTHDPEAFYTLLSNSRLDAADLAALKRIAEQRDITVGDDVTDSLIQWERREGEARRETMREIVEALLRERPEVTIKFIRAFQQQLEFYEELEQGFERPALPNELIMRKEQFERLLRKQEEETAHGRSIDTWLRETNMDDICRELKIDQADLEKSQQKERENFVLSAFNTLKRGFKRIAWQFPAFERRLDPEGRNLADIQEDYKQAAVEYIGILSEYFEEQLRTEATKLIDQRKSEAETYVGLGVEEAFKKYGLHADAIEEAIRDTQEAVRIAHRKDVHYATDVERKLKELPDVHDLRFVDYGQALLRRLRNLSTQESLISEKQKEQHAAEEWALETAPSLRMILEETGGDTWWRIERTYGKQTRKSLELLWETIGRYASVRTPDECRALPPIDRIDILDFPRGRRENIGRLVEDVAKKTVLQAVEGDLQEINRLPDFVGDLQAIRDNTSERVNTVLGELLPIVNHGACRMLDVQGQLQQKRKKLLQYLAKSARFEEQGNEEQAQFYLKATHFYANKLETALERAHKLHTNIKVYDTAAEYQNATGETSKGFYDYATGRIYLNREECGPDLERIRDHELGHAIMHVLIKQANLFPAMLKDGYEQVRRELGEANVGHFDALMNEQAEHWELKEQLPKIREHFLNKTKDAEHPEGDPEGAKEKALHYYNQKLLEELYSRYVDYLEKSKDPDYDPTEEFEPGELELFAMLDNLEPKEAAESSPMEIPETTAMGLRMRRGEGGRMENFFGGDEEAEPHGVAATEGAPNLRQDLTDIERWMLKIESFKNVYPEYDHQLNQPLANIKDQHFILEHIFKTGWYPPRKFKVDDPENNTRFTKALTDLKTYTKKIFDNVTKVDRDKLNLSRTSATGKRGLRALWDSINWLTPLDLWTMVTEAAEDIQRMWKRRGEKVRSRVGEGVTGWISDKVPYLGRLKHEFYRREKASEQEEVDVWEKPLEQLDSFDLQDSFRNIRDRDQLKATMNLLTKRGRLDWSDERLWKTLSAISSFNMPVAACRRDELLRDEWIRKLITNIWDDSDLYHKWRTANDSGAKSGTGEFTTRADYLSNISLGLSGELKLQLQLFKEAKEQHKPIPDKVNPHYYEELIHYSMRNGKMSMEDKFFYLIQGIDAGLIPLDRLRALAGEEAGILNQFPFIDYFYQKNNSMSEISALAERLREDDPYTPGSKTTIWLQLELAREQSVRMRVSKGLERVGEKVDHEDIPMSVVQLDYQGLANLYTAWSGSRQRVTPEGLKNAYVGFNTQFSAFATLAKLDKDGEGFRFTRADAQQLAQSLATYIHMDNIVTGAATDGRPRPLLSWHAINNTPPPSGGSTVTKKFRDSMNAFAKKVVDDLNVDLSDIDSNYLGENRREETPENTKEIFQDTGKFAAVLENAILENSETFRDLLIAHSDDREEKQFIPEQTITAEAAKSVLRR